MARRGVVHGRRSLHHRPAEGQERRQGMSGMPDLHLNGQSPDHWTGPGSRSHAWTGQLGWPSGARGPSQECTPRLRKLNNMPTAREPVPRHLLQFDVCLPEVPSNGRSRQVSRCAAPRKNESVVDLWADEQDLNQTENVDVRPDIEPGWADVLTPEFRAPYFNDLKRFLVEERASIRYSPKAGIVFRAFALTRSTGCVSSCGGRILSRSWPGPWPVFSVPDGSSRIRAWTASSKARRDQPCRAHLGRSVALGPARGVLPPARRLPDQSAGQHAAWEDGFQDAPVGRPSRTRAIGNLSRSPRGSSSCYSGTNMPDAQRPGRYRQALYCRAPHPSPLRCASLGFHRLRPFLGHQCRLLQAAGQAIDWSL